MREGEPSQGNGKGEEIVKHSQLERILAELRQWHELNARELEGQEGERENFQFHQDAAEAIKEAVNLIR